jgi:formate hydrogenlyase transcriptional activator
MDGPSQSTDVVLRQYQVLVQAAESITAHRDLETLLRDLKKRLRQVVSFDASQLVLHDPKKKRMLRFFVPPSSPPGTDPVTEFAVDEVPAGEVWQTQEPMLITDPATIENRYPRIVAELRLFQFRTAYILPLTSQGGRRLGAIVFVSRRESAGNDDDKDLLRQVSRLVAVAVENTINFERARAAESELKRQLEHLRLMLKVTNEVFSQLDLQELLQTICSSIREAMGNDIVDVSLIDHETGQLRAVVTNFPPGHPLVRLPARSRSE